MAKAWRLTPARWHEQSLADRAEMMAHEMIDGVREAFVAERHLEQMEKKQRPEPEENSYQRQKREWLAAKKT